MQPRKIRVADVERLQHTLANVPEHRAEEVTTVQAIRMLSPQIHAMHAKGYALGAIAELLSENGVPVTATTLKTYLSQSKTSGRGRGGKNPSRRRAVPAPEVEAPGNASKSVAADSAGPRDAQQGVRVVAKAAPAVATPPSPAAATMAPKGTPPTTRPADEGSTRRSAFVPKEDTRDI